MIDDIAIYKLICIIPRDELSEELLDALVFEHDLTSIKRLYIGEVRKEDFDVT